MLNVLRDLVPLLDRAEDAALAEHLTGMVGPRSGVMRSGPLDYWIYREAGIDLVIKESRLDTIFLHLIPPPGYTPFIGILPAGPGPALDQARVRAMLGRPARGGGGEEIICDEGHPPRVIGIQPYWDRWEYPAYSFLCEYDDTTIHALKLVALIRPGSVPWYPELPEP